VPIPRRATVLAITSLPNHLAAPLGEKESHEEEKILSRRCGAYVRVLLGACTIVEKPCLP
jgi:hypothetical protein